jgi:hypothetical protein
MIMLHFSLLGYAANPDVQYWHLLGACAPALYQQKAPVLLLALCGSAAS